MRKAISFLVVLFLSPPAFSQSIQFGVKGGIPLSRYFRTAHRSDLHTSYYSLTNRYTVGPMVEVRLPWRMGLELDFLYKHYQFEKFVYSSTSGTSFPLDIQVRTKTTADSWTVPVLLKYHASDLPVGTFLEVGPSINRLGGMKQTQATRHLDSPISPEVTTTDTPEGLGGYRNNAGFVVGGGIEFRVKTLRLSPGVRTTLLRHKTLYSATAASYDGLLGAEQNQVEFLMGITF
jgi:Outer membrane protein beta-barrel domain